MRKLLYSSLAFIALFTSACKNPDDQEERFRSYVENNLERIMQEQREEFSLPFFEKPRIEFKFPNEEEERLRATYDYSENVMTIHTKKGFFPEDILDFNKSLRYLILEYEDAETILRHELGHYYEDRLLEQIGIDDQTDIHNYENVEKGVKLINEGVACYYQKHRNNEEVEELKDITNNLKYDNRFYYWHGYDLVKPILDKFGYKAIKYLGFNQPTDEDLKNLGSYQKRIMQNLEKLEEN